MKILLGYCFKQYTNKNGQNVRGYEVYFGNLIDEQNGKGYSPALRFNQSRKTWQNWFISEDTFNKIKQLPSLVGKAVQVYTDPDYGNIVSIQGQ